MKPAKQISMLEFRRDAEAVIRKVQQGKSLLLTYRGKPVMRLEPIDTEDRDRDAGKSLLALCELGERLVPPDPQVELTNEDIDRLVYGL